MDKMTRKLLAGQKLPKSHKALFVLIGNLGRGGLTVADLGDLYAIWTHKDGVITTASYVRKLAWKALEEVRDTVLATAYRITNNKVSFSEVEWGLRQTIVRERL